MVPSVGDSKERQGQDCILGRQLSQQGLFLSVEVLALWVEERACRVSMCDGYDLSRVSGLRLEENGSFGRIDPRVLSWGIVKEGSKNVVL